MIVQTVNYPLSYFATRLANERFDVRYMVDPAVDPVFWKPSDDSVMAFQQADLIIRNGASYAQWMKTATLPRRKTLDTSSAFASKLIKTKGVAHRHGNGPLHSHGVIAYTTWIDFKLAQQQARSIAERFIVMSPESEVPIRENLLSLTEDLQKLDSQMSAWAKKWGARPLLVSHPIYQYWARGYDLNIRSVHWEADSEWNPDREAELAKANAGHGAAWMVWESTPDKILVDHLKQNGIRSVVFDPCGNVPTSGDDWLSVMGNNLEALNSITP